MQLLYGDKQNNGFLFEDIMNNLKIGSNSMGRI